MSYDAERDLEYFKHPERWTQRFLPVKRLVPGDMPDCQVLHYGIVGQKNAYILINVNLWAESNAWAIAPRREITLDELVNEGWRVD